MSNDIYKNLIADIDRFTSGQEKCCQKGCSYCCYQLIEMVGLEEDFILDALDALDDNTINIIEGNLHSWFDFFDKNTSNIRALDYRIINDFMKLPFMPQLKCPLLINNECSIYESRPIACRIHYVRYNPQFCAEQPYRDSEPEACQMRNDVGKYLDKVSKGKEYIIPLTYVLAKYLIPNRRLKPFKKAILANRPNKPK